MVTDLVTSLQQALHLATRSGWSGVLFVYSLFWLIGLAPEMRAAAASAPTAYERLRASAKVAVWRVGLVVTAGMGVLSSFVAVPAALQWILLALVSFAFLAVLLDDFITWLPSLRQSIRALSVRTPPPPATGDGALGGLDGR